MMRIRWIIVGFVAGAILPAIASAEDAEAAAPDLTSTRLTLASPGLVHDGPAGTATLSVYVDGVLAGEDAETIATAGVGPLDALAVTMDDASASGAREIDVRVAWDGATALRVVGTLLDATTAPKLAIASVEYDADSPVRFDGDTAFLLTKGWSDEILTVGFAFATDVQSGVSVRLDADLAGTAHTETVEATRDATGAWAARFTIARIPDVMTWKATILVNGVVAGETGSQVTFPEVVVADSYFVAVDGSGLAAAGGVHEVVGHSQAIAVGSALFGPTIEATSTCANGAVSGSLSGEAWRLAELTKPTRPCADEADVSAASAEGGVLAGAGLTGTSALALGFSVLALAGIATGAWYWSTRRRPKKFHA